MRLRFGTCWTLDGVAPNLEIINETLNPTSAIVWLSGGVAKKKYHLKNTVTTIGGRTYEQFLWLRVIERD